MGDGAIALRDNLATVPWHFRVNLDVEEHFCTSVFIHPRQKEGLGVLEIYDKGRVLVAQHKGETRGTSIDIRRRKYYPKYT